MAAAVESVIVLYTPRQEPDMTCNEYLRLFRTQINMINTHGAIAKWHPWICRKPQATSHKELIKLRVAEGYDTEFTDESKDDKTKVWDKAMGQSVEQSMAIDYSHEVITIWDKQHKHSVLRILNKIKRAYAKDLELQSKRQCLLHLYF